MGNELIKKKIFSFWILFSQSTLALYNIDVSKISL